MSRIEWLKRKHTQSEKNWLAIFFRKETYNPKFDPIKHELATYKLTLEDSVVVVIFHGSQNQINKLYTNTILSEAAKPQTQRNVLMIFDKNGLKYDYTR